MDNSEIKALLEKYQRGACTNAEKKLIKEWLSTIKSNQAEHFADAFIEEQLSTTKNRIDQLTGIKPLLGRRRHYRWLAAAASFLLVISSIAIGTHYFKKQPLNIAAKQTGIEQHISNGWVYVQTQKGVTDHIKLPDGSFITLDASSSLRYPVKFANHKRQIYLDEGEGLFEVAKDKTSPFTVYTPKFATTALGTAFDIRSYAKENKVSISLLHGKIRIEDLHPTHKSDAERILLPHEQIVLNKQSGRLIKTCFDDETPITSWTDGVLSFRDASMDEVINSIENRFNVVITNNSSRTNWSYTGTFKGESVNDVIKTVCLTEGITYSINKNNVSLN